MSEAKVIFTLNGINLLIQCTSNDKMEEICKKYANKVCKDIKELMFLYGGNQLNLDLTFNEVANSIDKNNHEMKILAYELEKEEIQNKKIDNKIYTKKDDISSEKVKRINNEIYEMNRENISKILKNMDLIEEGRLKLDKELNILNDLEKKYGFLSSIGIKLLLKSQKNIIEGYIKAPDNSPYKNGIFNFIIIFHNEYPHHRPEIRFKTKIFHSEVNQDGRICTMLLNNWNPEITFSLILVCLYEFFIANNNNGYGNEATQLYRENINLFEQKCQEYTKLYASNKFNDKLEYLFQEYYDIKTVFGESIYLFYDFETQNCIKKEINGIIKFDMLGQIFNRECNGSNTVLLAKNKIFFHLNNYKELLENHIIFIAPNLYPYVKFG